MKEKIEKIFIEYQNAITEYFEMEVPIENDAEHMDCFLENLKKEILAILPE